MRPCIFADVSVGALAFDRQGRIAPVAGHGTALQRVVQVLFELLDDARPALSGRMLPGVEANPAQILAVLHQPAGRFDEGALIIKFWFHLSKKQMKARLKSLKDDPLHSWKISPLDWQQSQTYDRFVRFGERVPVSYTHLRAHET